MKLERIILGIFNDSFFEMKKSTNSLSYADFCSKIYKYFPEILDGDLIEIVFFAMIKSEEIIFLLDDIKTPLLIEKSYTCHELTLILENEDLFNKTKFYLQGQEIDKVTIKNTYKNETNNVT